jgi:Sap-like sulfolipid-1-addressing protein
VIASGLALALLSGVWPVGFAAMVAYLDRPLLRYTLAYLAGAVVAYSAWTALFLTVFRAAGLRGGRGISSGVASVVLGVLLVAFGVWAWRKPARPAKVTDAIDRRRRSPKLITAFGVGLVVWGGPSLPYLAGLKLISDARLSNLATAIYGVIAVVCALWIIELALVVYLLRPEPARHRLGQLNRWARDHGRRLLAVLLACFGMLIAVVGLEALL